METVDLEDFVREALVALARGVAGAEASFGTRVPASTRPLGRVLEPKRTGST